jgi:hypothetical protein
MFSPNFFGAACCAHFSVLFGCSCGTNVEVRVSASGNQSLKIVIHLNAKPDLSPG